MNSVRKGWTSAVGFPTAEGEDRVMPPFVPGVHRRELVFESFEGPEDRFQQRVFGGEVRRREEQLHRLEFFQYEVFLEEPPRFTRRVETRRDNISLEGTASRDWDWNMVAESAEGLAGPENAEVKDDFEKARSVNHTADKRGTFSEKPPELRRNSGQLRLHV